MKKSVKRISEILADRPEDPNHESARQHILTTVQVAQKQIGCACDAVVELRAQRNAAGVPHLAVNLVHEVHCAAGRALSTRPQERN